jgi:hypothetical protein
MPVGRGGIRARHTVQLLTMWCERWYAGVGWVHALLSEYIRPPSTSNLGALASTGGHWPHIHIFSPNLSSLPRLGGLVVVCGGVWRKFSLTTMPPHAAWCTSGPHIIASLMVRDGYTDGITLTSLLLGGSGLLGDSSLLVNIRMYSDRLQ